MPPIPPVVPPENPVRDTIPAPADPVMQLLTELVSKVDSIGLEVRTVHRRIANVAGEVNATKNQAKAATTAAQAANAATVAMGDTVDAIAFMLKDEIGGGLAEIDRKLDEALSQSRAVQTFHGHQIDHLMRWSQAHERKIADDAHGLDHDDEPNGNGNGHDPDIEIFTAED